MYRPLKTYNMRYFHYDQAHMYIDVIDVIKLCKKKKPILTARSFLPSFNLKI